MARPPKRPGIDGGGWPGAAPAGRPEGDAPPLVSHEDHTPGIGQYADPADMDRWLVPSLRVPGDHRMRRNT